MNPTTYLVFGDLHGRILPAFRLAAAWSRESGHDVAGLLQVGDLGWFPYPERLDRATARFSADDPLELGASLVVKRTPEADRVFNDGKAFYELSFTCGNHEDFEYLETTERSVSPKVSSFFVDYYDRVRCIRNGRVQQLAGGPAVGALWGIGERARKKTPELSGIQPRAALNLSHERFDVLLTHDSPRGAIYAEAGSQDISDVIRRAQPAFAFFGHYERTGRQIEGDFGKTHVYHMGPMTFGGLGGCAESGSVGKVTWEDGRGHFQYLDEGWLRRFTRYNWDIR